MSDRNLNSTIERILRDGKRRLNDADREMMAQLLNVYESSRLVIVGEVIRLEEQILWAIANEDGDLTEAWMRRQDWYGQLEQSIQNEIDRIEQVTRGQVNSARAAGAAEGSLGGTATIRAVPGAPVVNAGAVERWISAVQPGSPLDKVLMNFGPEIDKRIVTEITSGLVEGRGSSDVIRRVTAGVEDTFAEYRSGRIVRTEMMRSYRGAYRDQVDALPEGMVAGWRWISALDTRTCIACIGMHNHVFTEYPDFAHVQCRCTFSPVFSSRYAPPQEFVTGDMWFAEQDEDAQRQILGPGRYEVWESGTPLRGMVALEKDPVWGGTTRLIPVKDLRP